MERPTIVCLCGSTRFSQAFHDANLQETLAGKIVLSIGCDFKSDDALGLTKDDKARLDALHLRKIELADEVLFLNVNGYMGHSTLIEHYYARMQRKVIRYLEKPDSFLLYSDESSEAFMTWVKEQQQHGNLANGIECINRRTWFPDDVPTPVYRLGYV